MKDFFRGKKSISMQAYLAMSLIGLVVLQCALLLVVLVWRDFYEQVDHQSVDIFDTRATQQVQAVNSQFSTVVKHVVEASEDLTGIYMVEAALNRQQVANADLTDDIYQAAHVESAQVILDLLDACAVDGAFYIIPDASGTDTVSVDIQNIYHELEGDGYAAYELVVGSSQISKAYTLGINTQWDLKLDPEELTQEYYTMPLWAAEQTDYGSVQLFGYWDIPHGTEDPIYYTVPLLDELGDTYGVIGVSISQEYFQTNYVSRGQYAYEDSFYAVGHLEGDVLTMESALPNSVLVEEHMGQTMVVSSENRSGYNLYNTEIEGLGNLLLKIDALSMYSTHSPFAEEGLVYLTFVGEGQLYQYSDEIKNIFIVSFGITMMIGVLCSIIFGRTSSRKIRGLSQYVREMSPRDQLEFQKTNLLEIDDLTDAIKRMSDKIGSNTRTINRLFELTELNLGGFEVVDEEDVVLVTQYLCALLHIPHTDTISREEWTYQVKRLTRDMVDREKNVYRYVLDGKQCYLKIIQAPTETGTIGMVLDVTREIEAVLEAKYQLDFDALTKLHSRVAFHRKGMELMVARPNAVGALLFIDLDNLKYVNDTFGHEYGDLYLISASQLFGTLAENGGVAARMSGDEFAVYLHGYPDEESLLQVIEGVLEGFKGASIDLPDGSSQRIRFSTGLAWYDKDGSNITDLVKYADFAMYEAKHTSKGSVRQFDRQIYEEKIFMMENREAINQLIEGERVRFVFQPIVSLYTGEIYAYEALMRSELPDFKSPLEILKVAAAQFKLSELEDMLVRKAVATAYGMRQELGEARVFINSITSQLMCDTVYRELEETYGDFLRRIVIEITEAEDNTPEKMRQKVTAIKGFGMDLAIDDFGSGYSNELRILAINPDVVKIDMELLQGVAADRDKQLLCANIIGYCHAKGVRVIAEGIEERVDLVKIMELGADCVQGYYLARPAYEMVPIPVDKVNEIIEIRAMLENDK